ncbi:hypothetical protein DPMN_032582 [Dreissena polymorpha]|uniref:Helicase C-terminal domain-containing protein n=1 Tax=Dreissena polymorpha TaxID=45954 RepID=A0A9D4RK78_DREPO|nr:hypothetical protein DPMN_032582 [Dreissena polymorpha]
MGISIPNVEIVLHWGCPKNPLAYWQELGREGRLGQPALGIVYAYPRSLIKRYTEDNIINIVNGDKCIGIYVFEHLMTAGMKGEDLPSQSPCADFCVASVSVISARVVTCAERSASVPAKCRELSDFCCRTLSIRI